MKISFKNPVSTYGCITVDKEYEVTGVDGNIYQVKDDLGVLSWVHDSIKAPKLKSLEDDSLSKNVDDFFVDLGEKITELQKLIYKTINKEHEDRYLVDLVLKDIYKTVKDIW